MGLFITTYWKVGTAVIGMIVAGTLFNVQVSANSTDIEGLKANDEKIGVVIQDISVNLAEINTSLKFLTNGK